MDSIGVHFFHVSFRHLLLILWNQFIAPCFRQSRNPPVLPLSITISQFKNDTQDMATPTLTYVLREILTLSAYLPLSLNRLNTHKFIPESVNEDLHAGFLQLPKGTVLILSDHEVEDGHLSDKGLRASPSFI